jgi:hypothetical protein
VPLPLELFRPLLQWESRSGHNGNSQGQPELPSKRE